MDYLGLLKGEQWIEISEDFNYVRATQDFVGLKLFPMAKTDNMKVAITELAEGGEIPVMALVHAFDTEADIGDRPDIKEFKAELLLVKRKLNQGEALRKKINDAGMSTEEARVIRAVYNDAANLIAQVLTRFEAMADEALCTGKLHIDEGNAKVDVDYGLPATHKLTVQNWSNVATDILGDLVKIKKASKNKIVRALVSDKVMGYITNNTKLIDIASKQGEYLTEDFAKNYISNKFGIEFIVVGGTYKKSYQDTTEYNFFDENTIVFLTTNGEVGKLFVTSTPEEDVNLNAQKTNGFVAVTQWVGADPVTVWTKASAVGFPAFRSIKQLYICSVK